MRRITLALALATASAAARADGPPATRPTPSYRRPPPATLLLPTSPGDHKLKFTTTVGGRAVTLPYLLHLPAGYGSGPRPPVLVFFHGIGECGTDLAGVSALGPMTVFGGPPSPGRTMAATCPFVVVCPQCPPRGEQWKTAYVTRATAELVAAVVHSSRVDADRVYATGLSMGGQGTWCVAEQAPDLFAAIAPLSARAWQPDRAGELLRYVPVWAVTGGQDSADFLDGGRAMAAALWGGPMPDRFTVDRSAGHWVFEPMFRTPELYEWLLAHRRPTAAARAKLPAPAVPEAVPTTPGQHRRTFMATLDGQAMPIDYVLFVPRGPGPHPAVLSLPEARTIGPAYHDVCMHGLNLALARHPAAAAACPLVVVAPQLPAKYDGWSTPTMTDALTALLAHVSATVPIDPARVTVAGVDEGAVAAWRLAAEHPDRFAAVVWMSTRADLNPNGDVGRMVAARPGRAFVPIDATNLAERITVGVAARPGCDWRVATLPTKVTAIDDLPPLADPALLAWIANQRRPAEAAASAR